MGATSGPSLGGEKEKERAQAALLASIASQTVLQKMGHAFWDAFAGTSSLGASSSNTATGPCPTPRMWDSEKVRKVLEGRAVLRVVDVEPAAKNSKAVGADALEESMRAMNLGGGAKETQNQTEKKGLLARMASCTHCSGVKGAGPSSSSSH